MEPGEIEAAMLTHPDLAEAVVVAGQDRHGDRRLVGYFVPAADRVPEPAALRAHLLRLLPEYLLPAAFVPLAALPLTDNGKVDRRALPEPDAGQSGQAEEPPELATRTERTVAGLWAEVLGVSRVGRDDNFFELGGHSLTAARLAGLLRRTLGLRVPFGTLFEHPTLAAFAAELDRAGRPTTAHQVRPTGSPGPFPLSFAQQRLWFLAQLQPESADYNVPLVMRLGGPLRVAQLRTALDTVIERHSVLRSVFPVTDGHPRQVVRPATASTLSAVDVPADEDTLRRLVSDEVARPFDLAEEPPLRARLLRVGPTDHVLVLTLHHIAVDARSIELLRTELARAYSAACLGRPADLPELPVQYVDYTVWQRQMVHSGALRGQLDHWHQRLAGLPVLDLPGTGARSRIRSGAGAALSFAVEPRVVEGLRTLTRTAGVTTNIVALAAFAVLLHRLAGQDDIGIGSPVVRRAESGVDNLVGCFLNMVTLRVDVSAEPTFTELLRRVRETTATAIENADVPFELVVDEVVVDRDTSRPPLFQVSFSHQLERPVTEEEFHDLAVLPFRVEQRTAKFELTLAVTESAAGLRGSWEYSTELFDEAMVRRLSAYYQAILRAVVRDPGQPVGALPVAEESPSGPAVYGPVVEITPRCAHELVAEQAARTPDSTAVTSGGRSLTYAELERRAAALAARLARRGVGPGSLVGIYLERGLDLVVALLGVWKAGGAYVPLDPGVPAERVAQVLADTLAPIVVTQRALAGALPDGGPAPLLLDDADADAVIAVGPAGPTDLAYVIFTSGSTGRPKGVQVGHAAVVNLLTSFAELLRPGPRDGLVAVTTLSFDISVLELLLPLVTGGRVIVAQRAQTTDPLALHALVCNEGGTVMQATPATWRMLTDSVGVPAGLRIRLCGGERLPTDLARELLAPGSTLWNVYGPTETTVWSTAGVVDGTAAPITIGAPIANTGLYVLDSRLAPTPVGVVGEIYLGGAGVARGYHGQPGLTAARFRPDPFAGAPGRRMYRTGDLGRRRPDGTVEFLGRVDQQIKIRGHRVEPAEIELALLGHPAVRQAVVLGRTDDAGGVRLVAYLVADGGRLPDPPALRDHLRHRLPDYMVPAAFVGLPALPLTPNGKLDRAALPAPDQSVGQPAGYTPPSTPTQELLAGIWADVLGLDDVGAEDNFFELGGDSILGIQVVSRARDAGLWLVPAQVFEFQTVAELARIVDGDAAPTVVRGAAAGPVPPTPGQRDLVDPTGAPMVRAVAVELPPGLGERAVAEALAELAEQHDVLRARLLADAQGRRLSVPAAGPVPLSVRQVEGGSAAVPSALRDAAETLATAIVETTAAALPDGTPAGPLVRAALVSGPAGERHLVLVALRRLLDRASWRIVTADIGALCARIAAGRPARLPEPTTSYRYWAERISRYAESGAARAEADYWLMADEPAPTLPPDGPDVTAHPETVPARSVVAELSAAETAGLTGVAAEWFGVSAPELVLAALVLTVTAETRGSALAVRLRHDGRDSPFPEVDLTRTVGRLTSGYPVRLPAVAGDITATARAVAQELRRVPHAGLAYGVLRHLSPDPDLRARLARAGADTVGFAFDGVPLDAGVRMLPLGPAEPVPGLDVRCELAAGRLRITWAYPAGRHREKTIRRLCANLVDRLRAALALGLAGRVDGPAVPARHPLATLTGNQLDDVCAEPGVREVYPLTPAQHGMLFHSLYSPGEGMYLNQTSFTLTGEFHPELFRAALTAVARRHDVLRTAIRWRRLAEPHQVVHAEVAPPLTVVDRSGAAASFRIADILAEEGRLDLEFSTAPLYRVTAVRLADDLHHVVWTNHHAIMDGWSSSLVFTECFQAYANLLAGRPVDDEPAAPYRDYVRWIQTRTPGPERRFWRDLLADLPHPAGLPKPVAESAPPARTGPGGAGPTAERVLRRELSAEFTTEVELFCKRRRLTLGALVYGAWAVALGRVTGEDDLVFGVILSGRSAPLPGIERMAGLLSTTLPMRVRLPRHDDVATFLKEVQSTLIGLGRFEYMSVAEAQRAAGSPPGRPLFDTTVGVQNFPLFKGGRYPAGETLSVRRGPGAGRNNYPLTVEVHPDARLGLRVRFDPLAVAEAAARQVTDELCAALARLVAEDPRAW
ncbi:amino acid adenylation domain-containing protein [Plantactinospora veratri]